MNPKELKMQSVTPNEIEELLETALATKQDLLDILCNKNTIESLKNYNVCGCVEFIKGAGLKNPSHEYRISFIKRAVINDMVVQLENNIKKIIIPNENVATSIKLKRK